MAKWSDIIVLIARISPADKTDDSGANVKLTERKKEIFANKKSVGYSEFYKADQAGHKTEMKFDVHTLDFEGETLAEYGGRRYKVLRTYGTKNDEFVELTLSDLSQRGATKD